MPNILEYYQQNSLNAWLIVVCTPSCNRTFSIIHANSDKVTQSKLFFLKSSIIRSNYTLQNWVYPKKYFSYTPEVPKSISNIKKSPEKEEKAVLKHSLHLNFYTFSGLFLLYSILNSSL